MGFFSILHHIHALKQSLFSSTFWNTSICENVAHLFKLQLRKMSHLYCPQSLFALAWASLFSLWYMDILVQEAVILILWFPHPLCTAVSREGLAHCTGCEAEDLRELEWEYFKCRYNTTCTPKGIPLSKVGQEMSEHKSYKLWSFGALFQC